MRFLRLSMLAGAAVALLAASPAWSAGTVKDVRVGKHPDFTRIVFELDRATGYQIERNEPAPGIAELVISLDASGTSGEVKVPKSLIDAVRLQSDGQRTVAHIRLAKGGLRHKEMTLREPARIVIDVIDDAAGSAVARAPRQAPKPAAKPTPKPVIEPKPVEEAKPAPAPVEVAKTEPKPQARPAVEPEPAPAERFVPAPTPKPKPVAAEEPAEPVTTAKADVAEDAADDEAEAKPAALGDRGPGAPSDPTAPLAAAEPVVPATRKGPRTSLPPVPPAPARESSGLFTPRNVALAVAMVILLAAGSFVVARRRSATDELEDDFDAEEFGDDNPFAGLESAGEGETSGAAAPTVGAREDDDQADLFAAAVANVSVGEPGTKQDTAGGETSSMEGPQMSMDAGTEFGADPHAATTLAPASSAAGSTPDLEGVMRMVRELAARVGDLETRLEDAVDAKERLERQVAAQTEELRVQRAAIARTQRAVRNMSQSAEDTPTEPAPRTPSSGD